MTRDQLQELINTRVYTNDNREIAAQFLREVLEALKDSDFNISDDTLENKKYNQQQTLAQYLSNIIGQIRTEATIGAWKIENKTDLTVTGSASNIITNADIFDLGGGDAKIVVNFNVNVDDKSIIPVIATDAPFDNGINLHNDLATPVIRRDSSTQRTIGIRQISSAGVRDRYFLNLIFL